MTRSLCGVKVGFALTGSFCTLDRAVAQMEILRGAGAEIIPIISTSVRDTDSRFGTAAYWRQRIKDAARREEIIDTIALAEPIGPQRMCDVMVIAPCTGNTAPKLSLGIIDTPVLMAAKSHLRNGLPLVVAIATNDGLAANAKSLGALLSRRHLFFVPFGQDSPLGKPNSLVAQMELIPDTLANALENRQIQPILSCKENR